MIHDHKTALPLTALVVLGAVILLASGCAANTSSFNPNANCSVNGGNNIGQLPLCNPNNPNDIPAAAPTTVAPPIHNPASSAHLKERLIRDGSEIVAAILALWLLMYAKRRLLPSGKSVALETRKKRLVRYAESRISSTTIAVANNPNIPDDVLSKLAEHEKIKVAVSAAFNPNIERSDFDRVSQRFVAESSRKQLGIFNSTFVARVVCIMIKSDQGQGAKFKRFITDCAPNVQAQLNARYTRALNIQNESTRRYDEWEARRERDRRSEPRVRSQSEIDFDRRSQQQREIHMRFGRGGGPAGPVQM